MPDYKDTMRGAARASEGGDDEFHRVAARARAEARRPAPRSTRPVFVAVTGLALAAAVLWALIPPPRVDRAFTEPGAATLGAWVQVEAAGAGEVSGVARKMDVRWTEGKLSVEVEPDRGVEFSVNTEEAQVRVVGTAFDVVRDALGTTVFVRHGRVAVDCASGETGVLSVGESRVCPPVLAAGALGRVLALRGSASPADLLGEIDRSLSLPDAAGPVAAELHVLRVSALLAAGRTDDARVEALLALSLADVTRAEELHRVVARIAAGAGDCAGALPHLRALEVAGVLGEDAAALATCSVP